MHLGACLLLPEGFDEHPEARYPLIVFHGHFPRTFGGFRETPPDPDLEPDYSERFRLAGYNRIEQEYAYSFFKEWTGPKFPRVGLGLSPESPDWGSTINDGRRLLSVYPHPAIVPALALMSLVLGLNLLADGLREESLKD